MPGSRTQNSTLKIQLNGAKRMAVEYCNKPAHYETKYIPAF